MKTFLAILATVALAGWLALVVTLSAPPPRNYTWTVSPATAPLSEGVGEWSDNP